MSSVPDKTYNNTESPPPELNTLAPLEDLIAQKAIKPFHSGPHRIAFLYTPELVRKILTDSHCFLEKEIKEWNTPMLVPIGVNRPQYVPVTALKTGLTPCAQYLWGIIEPATEGDYTRFAKFNWLNGIQTFPHDSPVAYTPTRLWWEFHLTR